MKQKYENTSVSKKNLFINNFLGGVAWGLGATIGVALILTILGFIAQAVNPIPVIGTFISHLIDYVLQTNKHFKS